MPLECRSRRVGPIEVVALDEAAAPSLVGERPKAGDVSIGLSVPLGA